MGLHSVGYGQELPHQRDWKVQACRRSGQPRRHPNQVCSGRAVLSAPRVAPGTYSVRASARLWPPQARDTKTDRAAAVLTSLFQLQDIRMKPDLSCTTMARPTWRVSSTNAHLRILLSLSHGYLRRFYRFTLSACDPGGRTTPWANRHGDI